MSFIWRISKQKYDCIIQRLLIYWRWRLEVILELRRTLQFIAFWPAVKEALLNSTSVVHFLIRSRFVELRYFAFYVYVSCLSLSYYSNFCVSYILPFLFILKMCTSADCILFFLNSVPLANCWTTMIRICMPVLMKTQMNAKCLMYNMLQ